MRLLITASAWATLLLATTANAMPSSSFLQGSLLSPRELLSELLDKRDGGNSIQSRKVHHVVEQMAHQDDWAGFRLAGCDLSGAQLPKTGVKDGELPDPDPSYKLTRVVLGIGAQNYTCAGNDKQPQSNGALAIFYDASCLAIYSPSLLHDLPNALVQVPHKNFYTTAVFVQRFFNTENNPDEPHKRENFIAGHHFFQDSKTPVFDFRSSSPDHDRILYGSIKNRVAAPQGASKGRHGHAYGAVDWLQLVPKEGDSSAQTVGYKMAYRVVTAGGKPPSTCNGFGNQIEIPYVAEYWFYS